MSRGRLAAHHRKLSLTWQWCSLLGNVAPMDPQPGMHSSVLRGPGAGSGRAAAPSAWAALGYGLLVLSQASGWLTGMSPVPSESRCCERESISKPHKHCSHQRKNILLNHISSHFLQGIQLHHNLNHILRRLCGLSLTRTSLRGAWLYMCKRTHIQREHIVWACSLVVYLGIGTCTTNQAHVLLSLANIPRYTVHREQGPLGTTEASESSS